MNKEKLIKEIGYEKTQINFCLIRLNQIIERLNDLQIKIENGDFS